MKSIIKKHPDIAGVVGAYVAGGILVAVLGAILIYRPVGNSSSAGFSANVGIVAPEPCSTTRMGLRCIVQNPRIIVETGSLPSGIKGKPYDYQFTVKGGTAPYTWQTSTGISQNIDWYPCCLLALSPSGKLASVGNDSGSGHMPYVGTYQVGVVVTDAKGRTGSGVYQFTINPTNVGGPLTILDKSPLPDAKVGDGYYKHFQFSGGNGGPYVWSMLSSAPVGASPQDYFTFSKSGILSTPYSLVTAGTRNFSMQLTDGSQTVSKNFTLTIIGPPVDATEDTPYQRSTVPVPTRQR